MNTATTAIEAHEQIEKAAPALSDKKTLKDCPVGKGIRQGDLYVIRVKPTGKTTIKRKNAENIVVDASVFTMLGSDQLAPGTTMGSRHTIREQQASFHTDPTGSNPLVGGLVTARTNWDLEHPEHGDWNLPAGTYCIFYQLDWATKERVKD